MTDLAWHKTLIQKLTQIRISQSWILENDQILNYSLVTG